MTTRPPSRLEVVRGLEANLWTYRARVPYVASGEPSVVDGDTLRAVVDLGMSVQTLQDLRVEGVDTPEIVGAERPAGLAAKAFTAQWIREHDHGLLWPFLIQTMRDRRSFTRYRASVVCVDGDSLAEAIIRAGHSKPPA